MYQQQEPPQAVGGADTSGGGSSGSGGGGGGSGGGGGGGGAAAAASTADAIAAEAAATLAEITAGRGGAPVDETTARQVRIAGLFKFRLEAALRTSAAKHALIPTDCLSEEVKCVVSQTQAKNDYVLTPEELENVTIRQNKKRRFYCPAELDAIGIEKFGFQKFLRKKFRSSAGVKTAEKTVARLRGLEVKATRDEAVTAAKHAVAFLTLKAQHCQAALAEVSKQFRLDFPKEAEESLPPPKANARLLKKEVQAVASALKSKYKEKIDKIKQSVKAAKRQARGGGGAGGGGAGGGSAGGVGGGAKPAGMPGAGPDDVSGRPACKRCGSTQHMRSSKKQCPKYKPRATAASKKRGAGKAVGPKPVAEVVATPGDMGMMIPGGNFVGHVAHAYPPDGSGGGGGGGGSGGVAPQTVVAVPADMPPGKRAKKTGGAKKGGPGGYPAL